jgi:hypothetical protein
VQPAQVDHGGRPRFPALDPEPPPRPWWRRVLPPAGVIVAVAAVAIAVVDRSALTGWARHGAAGQEPAGGQRPAGTLNGGPVPGFQAPGRILVQAPTGGLAAVDADGRSAISFTKLGQFPALRQAASGSRYVWLGDGQILSLASLSKPAVVQTRITAGQIAEPAVVESFAGHDRYVVTLTAPYGAVGTNSHIFVNSIATGRRTPLGNGDLAVGDPQTAGAFVTVAAPPRASASGNELPPDARLELRRAGHRPVTLATAAMLNHDLGAPSGRAVSLMTTLPSPSGNEIAVEVATTTASPTAEILVLSRTGKVLDIPAAPGPPSDLVWSPGGRTLAYTTLGTAGRGLTIWTVGGGSITMTFPFTGARYDRFLWSPDGATVLCSDITGRHWVFAHAAGGQMTAIPGHGIPVAWIR